MCPFVVCFLDTPRSRSRGLAREAAGILGKDWLLTRKFDCSAPVAAGVVPAVAIVPSVADHPNGLGVGRICPMSRHPEPAAAAPDPFAFDPDVIRAGRCQIWFCGGHWWGLVGDIRCWRSGRGGGRTCAGAQGRRAVQHEVDDFVAYASVAQIDDIRSAKVEYRVGTDDLVDDGVVRGAGFGQRFDIGNGYRRALIYGGTGSGGRTWGGRGWRCGRDWLAVGRRIGGGGFSGDFGVLFPVRFIAKQSASEGTGGGADQGAFTTVARTSGGRAHERAKNTADDGAGTGVVLGTVRIDTTSPYDRTAGDGYQQKIQFQFMHIQTDNVSDNGCDVMAQKKCNKLKR